MTIEFDGTVCSVLPLKTGMGARGPWSRATVVFEIPAGRFTEKIACENTADAERFSQLQLGQKVHVRASVSSREYQEKWYTSVLCLEFSTQQPTAYAAPEAAIAEGPKNPPF